MVFNLTEALVLVILPLNTVPRVLKHLLYLLAFRLEQLTLMLGNVRIVDESVAVLGRGLNQTGEAV